MSAARRPPLVAGIVWRLTTGGRCGHGSQALFSSNVQGWADGVQCTADVHG